MPGLLHERIVLCDVQLYDVAGELQVALVGCRPVCGPDRLESAGSGNGSELSPRLFGQRGIPTPHSMDRGNYSCRRCDALARAAVMFLGFVDVTGQLASKHRLQPCGVWIS